MTEADLEALLERALDVEPSADFGARVRTRLANAPAAPSRTWVPWVAWAAAAGVAVAAVVVGARRPALPIAAPGRAVESAAPAEPAGVTPPPSRAMAATPPAIRTVRPRSTPPPAPEIVVEAGQDQALLRLRAALRSGRIDARSLLASRSRLDAPIAVPADIAIAPLDAPSETGGLD
jgi:hypothetical protein